MMKTMLATVLATAFLISAPVRGEDQAPAGDKAEKAKNDNKKDKQSKQEKKETAKKEEKPSGGGW